jgi:hypothetical protein
LTVDCRAVGVESLLADVPEPDDVEGANAEGWEEAELPKAPKPEAGLSAATEAAGGEVVALAKGDSLDTALLKVPKPEAGFKNGEACKPLAVDCDLNASPEIEPLEAKF